MHFNTFPGSRSVDRGPDKSISRPEWIAGNFKFSERRTRRKRRRRVTRRFEATSRHLRRPPLPDFSIMPNFDRIVNTDATRKDRSNPCCNTPNCRIYIYILHDVNRRVTESLKFLVSRTIHNRANNRFTRRFQFHEIDNHSVALRNRAI